MAKKECIAMILAGGQGTRLGVMTKKNAKPAVPFGGKYKIIDFTLSNCSHSGIDTVGFLTQYQPLELNTYIGNGQTWDLDSNDGGIFVLPPYVKDVKGEWYKGTANAIFQNINFIEQFNPEYILVLSGDHIYKMDYSKMISCHKKKGASATIAVIEVPLEDAGRFGIITADEDDTILKFDEKPKQPSSNLASMGVYVFNWAMLKKYLMVDENNQSSQHDFGQNIIPALISGGEKLSVYRFGGYWKDVGTVQSLWEANMDLLKSDSDFSLSDGNWCIYSRSSGKAPHYVADSAEVKNSFVASRCEIYGKVSNSVLFEGVKVDAGAEIYDSIVMPNCVIGREVKIYKSIICSDSKVKDGAKVGVHGVDESQKLDTGYRPDMCGLGITVLADNVTIDENVVIGEGCMVETDVISMKQIHPAVSEEAQDESKMIS